MRFGTRLDWIWVAGLLTFWGRRDGKAGGGRTTLYASPHNYLLYAKADIVTLYDLAYKAAMTQLARTRQQLGAVIRRHRCKRGWTQAELAARAGTRQATISEVEAGQDVRFSTVSDVLAALDLELAVQPRSSGDLGIEDLF